MLHRMVFLGLFVLALAMAGAGEAATTAQASPAGSQAAAARAVIASGEAKAIASAGAPQLAIKLVDVSQPSFAQAPAAWAAWERARLDILSAAGDYKALDASIRELPVTAPQALHVYAWQLGAGAALDAEEPGRARLYLRRLIWSYASPSSATLTGYRRLVLRSYVVGDQWKDAQRALSYLQRDGHVLDRHMREIAAEVALERGEPRLAVHLLSGLKQPAVRPLLLLAELRAGIHSPARAMTLSDRGAHAAEQRKQWQLAGRLERVRAEAAARADDPEVQLAALAAALILNPSDSGPLRVTPAQLWHTWVATGLQLGNQRRLLLGSAGPWLKAAARENKAHRPMLALALLAAEGMRSPDATARAVSLAAFARQLKVLPRGIPLALTLFSNPRLFPDPEQLPGALRYQLLEPAVSTGRMAFASALVTGLDKPPVGADAGEWQLQRARLLLLGGDMKRAVRILTALAHGKPPIPAKKLLPVVVNLETLGGNRDALDILQAMLAARPAPPPKQARQILYWIGKAWSGLGSPLESARYYLDAASFNSPFAMDQWAQTARYSAAAELTTAGLYKDAIRLYKGLLNATSDPVQQAQIRQKLAAVRTLANRAASKSAEHAGSGTQ